MSQDVQARRLLAEQPASAGQSQYLNPTLHAHSAQMKQSFTQFPGREPGFRNGSRGPDSGTQLYLTASGHDGCQSP